MATAYTTSTSNNSEQDPGDEEKEESKTDTSKFECNICLDTAKDAVISMCGHLFCWPCLHQWLKTRPNVQTCPVCKASISKEKVIPLYGRGSSDQQDPREKAPPRPPGQRTEPEPQHGFMPGFNFGEGEGFQFNFGIGAFPFGIFTSFNNLGFGGHAGVPGAAGNAVPTQRQRDDQFLSQVFITMAIIFIVWLILV